MDMRNWKPRSDWGKHLLAEAKHDAKVEGRVEAILDVFDARGLVLDHMLFELITACTDLDLLERWLRCAAIASCTEEVFGVCPVGVELRRESDYQEPIS